MLAYQLVPGIGIFQLLPFFALATIQKPIEPKLSWD
jgi:hypothetical protein